MYFDHTTLRVIHRRYGGVSQRRPAGLLRGRIATLAVLVLAFGGCNAIGLMKNGVRNRLLNQGPVQVSEANPYLRGNQLISEEEKLSPVITGFLQHRGLPSAVEIRKEFLESAIMYFYYPQHNELFTFEEVGDTWLIDGPTPIPDQLNHTLAAFESSPQSSSPSYISVIDADDPNQAQPDPKPTPDYTFSMPDSQSPTHKIEDTAPDPFLKRLEEQGSPPRQVPTPPPPSGGFRSVSQSHGSGTPPTQKAYDSGQSIGSTGTLTPQRLTELRSSVQDSPAEQTPNGDLVHYVTFPGETLRLITEWYTLDRANEGRIARINQVKDPNALNVGDVVVVPSYLVRFKNRLPEAAVKQLR